MKSQQSAAPTSRAALILNVFCTPESGAWRVYLAPGWVPRYLKGCFDRNGEAFPAYLDFEELDRQMIQQGHEYEKTPSLRGDLELTAKGAAASALATWLASAFASGVRTSP